MTPKDKPMLVDHRGNTVLDSSGQRAGALQGGGYQLAAQGGIVNPATGLGLGGDKTSSAYFAPTVLRVREKVLPFYVESWVARKFINMPIDDMFFKGRKWTGDDKSANQAMEDAWHDLDLENWLSCALKNGRLYGTGFLALMVDNAAPEVPLMPEMVKEGQLKNVLALDRFDVSIIEDPAMQEQNLYMREFGQPTMLQVNTIFGHQYMAHTSRLVRFDGVPPLNSQGWQAAVYDRFWGISELIAAIVEIIHDASFSSAVAHMGQEASIPVFKIQGWDDAITGKAAGREATVEQIATAINLYKSIFRSLFIGESDEFTRVAIQFGGVAPLFQKYAERVAAMADIPATRFLATSPDGMNSTGESDMRNYAIHVGAMQRRKLARPLRFIDQVVARHAGLAEPPDYEWLPLLDLSENERFTNAQLLAQATNEAAQAAGLDENEVREILRQDETFSSIEDLPEGEVGVREELERQLTQAQIDRENQPPAGAGAGNDG